MFSSFLKFWIQQTDVLLWVHFELNWTGSWMQASSTDILIFLGTILFYIPRLWTASVSLRSPELPQPAAVAEADPLLEWYFVLCSVSEVALVCSSSVRCFLANSSLDFLLFDIFSPHIKHTGKPASLEVEVNEDVQAELLYLYFLLRFSLLGSFHGYCRVGTLRWPQQVKVRAIDTDVTCI